MSNILVRIGLKIKSVIFFQNQVAGNFVFDNVNTNRAESVKFAMVDLKSFHVTFLHCSYIFFYVDFKFYLK